MYRFVLLLPLALACAGAARAQPYVSGEIGYASADFALGAPFNGVVDDRAPTYGFNVGLGIGRRWAIEAGVAETAGLTGRGTPCPAGEPCILLIRDVPGNDMRLYKLSVVPRFEIGDVRVYGRAGYYSARIDANVPFPNNELTERGVLLGAGVQWQFNEPWSVAIEASRFDDKLYQLAVAFGWGLDLGAND